MTQQDVAAAVSIVEDMILDLGTPRPWTDLARKRQDALRLILTALQQRSGAVERERVARIVRVACVDYAALPGRGHHTHRRAIVEKTADAILGGQS